MNHLDRRISRILVYERHKIHRLVLGFSDLVSCIGGYCDILGICHLFLNSEALTNSAYVCLSLFYLCQLFQEALATCAQTLRPVCQAHIFHTATHECFVFNMGARPILSHCHSFNTISNSLYLVSLVRELRFSKLRNSEASLLRISEEESMVHQGVITQLKVALPQLKKVLVLRTPTGSLI